MKLRIILLALVFIALQAHAKDEGSKPSSSAGKTESEESNQAFLKGWQARQRKTEAGLAVRQEQELWQKAQAGENALAVQDYLDKYPTGSHAAAAQDKLTAIRKADDLSQQEQALWNQADTSNDKAAVETYLNKYPSGRYVAAASDKLKALKEEEAKYPAMVRILGKNYEMGKYEVTQKEWRDIMGSNPSKFSYCGDTCPVEQVSWNNIQEFIQKLNSKTGKQYRLPTEAEWSYACYGGSQTEYCGGNDVDSVAWYVGNSGDKTHPVGQKQANGYGLYDMSGNAWEWMSDCRASDCAEHVIGGGGFFNKPQHVRAAYRYEFDPTYLNKASGFRMARTLP